MCTEPSCCWKSMGQEVSRGTFNFPHCCCRTRTHSSQSENFANSNTDPLYLLSILFRIFALPIDPKDHIYWKIYHFLVLLCLFISFIGLVISAINKLNEDIFNTISAILFSFNGLLSYLCLSITVYSHQHNLLEIIRIISKDSAIYPSLNPNFESSSDSSQSLKFFCYKWLRIAAGIGLLSYSLLFIAYGRRADTHFFDVGDNPGWHLGNILYLYFNAGWLIPMVLVRVGCHFLEERIFSLIEYLEEPESREMISQLSQSSMRPRNSNESHKSCITSSRILSAVHSLTSSDVVTVSQQHNSPRLNIIGSYSRISIRQIMSWYDEIYSLNQLLSNALGLIIFQAIICLFPVVVFMLQVNSYLDHVHLIHISPGFPPARYFPWNLSSHFLLDLHEFIRPFCCDIKCSTN
jgi:hypothetical protein